MVRTIAIIIYIARRLVSTITAVLISVSGECTTDHGDVSIYIYIGPCHGLWRPRIAMACTEWMVEFWARCPGKDKAAIKIAL